MKSHAKNLNQTSDRSGEPCGILGRKTVGDRQVKDTTRTWPTEITKQDT